MNSSADEVRAATILISGGRRPAKCKDKKKAKTAHPKPNLRTIVSLKCHEPETLEIAGTELLAD